MKWKKGGGGRPARRKEKMRGKGIIEREIDNEQEVEPKGSRDGKRRTQGEEGEVKGGK